MILDPVSNSTIGFQIGQIFVKIHHSELRASVVALMHALCTALYYALTYFVDRAVFRAQQSGCYVCIRERNSIDE